MAMLTETEVRALITQCRAALAAAEEVADGDDVGDRVDDARYDVPFFEGAILVLRQVLGEAQDDAVRDHGACPACASSDLGMDAADDVPFCLDCGWRGPSARAEAVS